MNIKTRKRGGEKSSMISKMSNFYIYMYLDLDNVPFYIGKGKNNRYKVQNHLKKHNTNAFLKSKIRKVGTKNVKIHFLHKDITEEESFSWERYWIKYIGRRDKGEGSLCNLTDGGEGPSGYIHTNEARRKMCETHEGEKNSMYGKSHTKETRQKISAFHKGKKISDETREKMGESAMGHTCTDKVKQKIRDAIKGIPKSEEALYNMRMAQKKRRKRERIKGD